MNRLDLVADIGGTNTRVALCEGGKLLPQTITRFRNADHRGLETVLSQFLKGQGAVDCHGACVAIAGPVANGRGTLTNLDWQIDVNRLAEATGASHCALINDLQAQGHGLGHLADGTVTTLIDAPDAGPEATKLVIGVGTGFNVACVFETPTGRLVPPAEAGHANLPVRDGQELDWARDFEKDHGVPAIEDMLSGRGLERVHSWFSNGTSLSSAAEIAEALKNKDAVATQTAHMFVRMLGTVAGNLSLIHLPFGGVFFVGGVARTFAPYFSEMGFEAAFCNKGRFADFMGQFPVHVVTDDYAALTGCAQHLHVKVVETR